MNADARRPRIHAQPGESRLLRGPGILCPLPGACAAHPFRAGYRIAASSLGGQAGTHIRLNTAGGEAPVRRFDPAAVIGAARRQRAAASEV